MKKHRKKTKAKVGTLFVISLLALTTIGVTYSCWKENLYIKGTIKTGTWKETCIQIKKTLEGPFTNPYNGSDLQEPENNQLIHIGTNEEPGWPTKFKLIITVKNNGTKQLTDVVVEDKIENNVAPRGVEEPHKGEVTFSPYGFEREWNDKGFDFLYWNIGTLDAGETAELVIWIETLANPSGVYEPTTEEGQDIPINGGATVTATSEQCSLSAATWNITIYTLDHNQPEDNIARINWTGPYNWANETYRDIGSSTLPYSTPWAWDFCPTDS